MISRRAFTLVELLVVIGIIVVLMSLVMGAVMIAKRMALRTKATAQINTLVAAVETYNALNGSYPEKWKVPAAVTDDTTAVSTALAGLTVTIPNPGDDIYATVFYDSGSGTAKAATAITPGDWALANAVLVRQLMSIDAALGQKGNGLILDPWNKPLRYRPSKWYPMSGAPLSAPRVDAEDAPNPASCQVWSSGADLQDDAVNPGEAGDDLANWPRK